MNLSHLNIQSIISNRKEKNVRLSHSISNAACRYGLFSLPKASYAPGSFDTLFMYSRGQHGGKPPAEAATSFFRSCSYKGSYVYAHLEFRNSPLRCTMVATIETALATPSPALSRILVTPATLLQAWSFMQMIQMYSAL